MEHMTSLYSEREKEKEKQYLKKNPLILELKYKEFKKYLVRKCWKLEVNLYFLQISKAKCT